MTLIFVLIQVYITKNLFLTQRAQSFIVNDCVYFLFAKALTLSK